jgi:hypothetical protein
MNHTGFVALLPYIEQDNLFKQYNYLNISNGSNPYGQPRGNDPAGNPNRFVGSQTIKTYTCPGDTNPAPVMVTTNPAGDFYERGVNGTYPGVARSNYFFNTGYYTDYDRDYDNLAIWARGPFGNNGAASISNMMDGTSNTIAIGESAQLRKTSTSFGPYWGAGTHTAVHGRILQYTRDWCSKAVVWGPTSCSGAACGINYVIAYCAINGPNNRMVTPRPRVSRRTTSTPGSSPASTRVGQTSCSAMGRSASSVTASTT